MVSQQVTPMISQQVTPTPLVKLADLLFEYDEEYFFLYKLKIDDFH